MPAIGFVLQLSGLFGAVGALVALRASRRWPGADTTLIVPAWCSVGFLLGLLTLLVVAVTDLLR